MWIEYFSFGYTSYNMLPKQRWIFDNSIVLKYFWVKKKGKNSSAVTFLGILIPKLSWAATNETRAFGAYFHRKYSEFIYFRAIMLKKGFQFKWTLYGVCVFFDGVKQPAKIVSQTISSGFLWIPLSKRCTNHTMALVLHITKAKFL